MGKKQCSAGSYCHTTTGCTPKLVDIVGEWLRLDIRGTYGDSAVTNGRAYPAFLLLFFHIVFVAHSSVVRPRGVTAIDGVGCLPQPALRAKTNAVPVPIAILQLDALGNWPLVLVSFCAVPVLAYGARSLDPCSHAITNGRTSPRFPLTLVLAAFHIAFVAHVSWDVGDVDGPNINVQRPACTQGKNQCSAGSFCAQDTKCHPILAVGEGGECRRAVPGAGHRFVFHISSTYPALLCAVF